MKMYILGRRHPRSRKLFYRTDQRVEHLNKVVFSAVFKVSLQVVMVPNFIGSFATYFTTDMESDSFELPFPMW